MARVWVSQDRKALARHGPAKAPWGVGFYDLEGRRRWKTCGRGPEGKKLADKLAKKIAAELLTGTYESPASKTWEEFRDEYRDRIAARMQPGTAVVTMDALDQFERIIRPKKLAAIKTTTIDHFIAERSKEAGKKRGSRISPATVNRDLRHLRAALRVAHDWGYLPELPKFRMVREPGQLPTYVTPEHFAAMYQRCDVARFPEGLPFAPADWWRGLLVTAYMTGWRISELLALAKDDLDLDAGTAITRAKDNKGKRDELVPLAPVVVEHLRRLASFEPVVFPWPHNKTTLYGQFREIQEAAGIRLPCTEQHEHTPACHIYGFHDLRRAFATMNADKLTADALQALMRHRSYSTTKRYINTARQLTGAVASLYVPDVLKAKKA